MSKAKAAGKAKTAPKLCGAKTRTAGLCKRPRGWGTSHPGSGRCKLHSGSTRNGVKAAAREEAHELALLLGDGVPLEPHEALLRMVHMAAAEVRFFTDRMSSLALADLLARPTTTTVTPGSALVIGVERGEDGRVDVTGMESATTKEEKLAPHELHLWMSERTRAMERLAKWSKMALDAGVNERQVQVAERYGDTLAVLLGGVLDDLGLTPAQLAKAPGICRKHLDLITTGGPTP